MRAYFSTQPVYNPLSTPTNSRFAAALAAISESSAARHRKDGDRNPNSPIYSRRRLSGLRQLPEPVHSPAQ